MPTRYRALDRARLRADLERTAFAAAGPLRDAFGIECEGFAVRWRDDAAPLPIGLSEPVAEARTLVDVVRGVAEPHGWQVYGPGDADAGAGRALERGSFAFGHGGQVSFRSAPSSTPAGAYDELASALDLVEEELLSLGLALVSFGSHPWSDVEHIGLQDPTAAARRLEALHCDERDARVGDLRLSAATRVFVGFGGPVHRDSRWNAAYVLSTLIGAICASAPLALGASTGFASTRLARRRLAARRGDPRLPPVDEYLARALDARVGLAPDADGSAPRELTFRAWMEQGVGGVLPDRDDWAVHLATLPGSIRPDGWLVLDASDALPRPFRSVPLVLWSALLADPSALARAVEVAGPVAELVDASARSGIAEVELGERARSLFAIAADVLLRRPPGWVSNPMLAAFVAYGARFASRSRVPADDVLETFSRRRVFDQAAHDELVGAWESEAGTVPLNRRKDRAPALGQARSSVRR